MRESAQTIGIVVSRADRASEHIGDHLLDLADWTPQREDHYTTPGFELRVYDDLHLDLEGVAADFDDPAFLVFVSRHSGDTGPLLSAHFTGNVGHAEFGGHDHALAQTCPNAQRTAVAALDDHAPDGYDVSLECTHHGPSDPGAPSMFVELGSDDAQWDDPHGAEAVARTVLDLRGVDPSTDRIIVAFGDPHYAPRPTRLVRDTEWACGHVVADWALDALGDPSTQPEVIDQVFTRSDTHLAIVDGDRPALRTTIEDLGYRVVSETWVRETDGVPLDLVEALESTLSTVDDGLRFGDHAAVDDANDDHATNSHAIDDHRATDTTEYRIVDLPDDLLVNAIGIDMAAVRNAARATTVAYETTENGNRVSGRGAFPTLDQFGALVDALCEILERKYEHVEREGRDVVVHDRVFDPARAEALGVPPGPKFGTLAAGDPVTVDDTTVTPADVTVEQTQRYSLVFPD